mmetsp:Transcript_14397/g.36711  ORF Transcript_14397/g.36711 Transcript_14397/m.36711 type:complete len:268 (-) Transcript_14397:1287-2090(-)
MRQTKVKEAIKSQFGPVLLLSMKSLSKEVQRFLTLFRHCGDRKLKRRTSSRWKKNWRWGLNLMSIFLCTTSRLQFLWQSKAIEFYIPSALSPSVFAPFSSYLISQQELRKPEHKFVNISSKDTLKQALSCISFECRQMIDIIESVPQEGVVSIQRDITNVMSMCSLLLDALSDDGRLLAARIANIYEKKYERISKTSCTQVADGGMVQEDLLKMLESSACVNLLEWNYDSASLAMERLLALSLRSEPKPHQKNVNNDNIDQRHAKEK